MIEITTWIFKDDFFYLGRNISIRIDGVLMFDDFIVFPIVQDSFPFIEFFNKLILTGQRWEFQSQEFLIDQFFPKFLVV